MEKILIIESGSTKADLAWLTSDGVEMHSTPGMNPAMKTDFMYQLNDAKIKQILSETEMIYFFGAGVATTESKEVVKQNFTKYTKANILVENDLMAAAKACLGDESGIIAILGTGSNSCYYDGTNMEAPIPSLGYIFSDEGGGTDLGRHLIKSYFYKEMPRDVHEKFESTFHLSKTELLKAIYQDHLGPSYLAAFAPFLNNVEGTWRDEFLEKRFTEFIEKRIKTIEGHKNHPTFAIGSIAANYKFELERSFQNNGLVLTDVIQKPIHNLVQYYRKKHFNKTSNNE